MLLDYYYKNITLSYFGDCTEIDYEGDNFGFDPTHLAQVEDNAIEAGINLSKELFWSLVNYCPEDVKDKLLNSDSVWYGHSINDWLPIFWAYNEDEDIHYLFEVN